MVLYEGGKQYGKYTGGGKNGENGRRDNIWNNIFFDSNRLFIENPIPGRVNISQAIPCLVNWAEEQLDDRYTDAQCHSVRISDPDPELAAMYKEAGQVLMYMAIKQLKKTIDLMVRREDKMIVLDEGVQEKLMNNNEKQTQQQIFFCTIISSFI